MSEKPTRIALGKLGRPHGVRGEVRLFPFNPASRTLSEAMIATITRDGQELMEAEVERARYADRFIILKLDGVDDRDEADALKHAHLEVDYEDLPELEEGQFYYIELVGAPVYVAPDENVDIDEDKTDAIGVVERFFATGANDVMVVDRDGDDALFVPLVEHAVFVLDFERHLVVLQPLEIWAPADD